MKQCILSIILLLVSPFCFSANKITQACTAENLEFITMDNNNHKSVVTVSMYVVEGASQYPLIVRVDASKKDNPREVTNIKLTTKMGAINIPLTKSVAKLGVKYKDYIRVLESMKEIDVEMTYNQSIEKGKLSPQRIKMLTDMLHECSKLS